MRPCQGWVFLNPWYLIFAPPPPAIHCKQTASPEQRKHEGEGSSTLLLGRSSTNNSSKRGVRGGRAVMRTWLPPSLGLGLLKTLRLKGMSLCFTPVVTLRNPYLALLNTLQHFWNGSSCTFAPRSLHTGGCLYINRERVQGVLAKQAIYMRVSSGTVRHTVMAVLPPSNKGGVGNRPGMRCASVPLFQYHPQKPCHSSGAEHPYHPWPQHH